jgi:hypothetical protein
MLHETDRQFFNRQRELDDITARLENSKGHSVWGKTSDGWAEIAGPFPDLMKAVDASRKFIFGPNDNPIAPYLAIKVARIQP